MSQTTINAGGNAAANAGDPANSAVNSYESGFNENTTQMPFGYGVRIGTAQNFFALASGFSGVLPVAGIVMRRADYQPAVTLQNGTVIGNQGASGLLQYAPLSVLRKGQAWVPVESAVTAGQRGWCRGIATGALTEGSWVGAANQSAPLGASYHVDCSKQTVFKSASVTAADGSSLVAIIECDFVNNPY